MPPRSRNACSTPLSRASFVKDRASKKLLLPAPFRPTKKVKGPSRTSQVWDAFVILDNDALN